ncbi:GIY-YIG nuclease family protein [Arthrobacter mobilis]|uniref:GIY-YIG nuclease family protein n=1 Tax=Arthrobacter mobilis TaxID=2724944 RepID=UPI0035E4320B
MLYIGIAWKEPPRNGTRPSTQTLWHRIRYHYRGNAEGSTLRLTLGCHLAGHLGSEHMISYS